MYRPTTTVNHNSSQQTQAVLPFGELRELPSVTLTPTPCGSHLVVSAVRFSSPTSSHGWKGQSGVNAINVVFERLLFCGLLPSVILWS